MDPSAARETTGWTAGTVNSQPGTAMEFLYSVNPGKEPGIHSSGKVSCSLKSGENISALPQTLPAHVATLGGRVCTTAASEIRGWKLENVDTNTASRMVQGEIERVASQIMRESFIPVDWTIRSTASTEVTKSCSSTPFRITGYRTSRKNAPAYNVPVNTATADTAGTEGALKQLSPEEIEKLHDVAWKLKGTVRTTLPDEPLFFVSCAADGPGTLSQIPSVGYTLPSGARLEDDPLTDAVQTIVRQANARVRANPKMYSNTIAQQAAKTLMRDVWTNAQDLLDPITQEWDVIYAEHDRNGNMIIMQEQPDFRQST